jgi:hypothetical protein
VTPISFFVPVKTQTEANANEHWRTRHGRASAQRKCTASTLLFVGRHAVQFPLVVRMTRVGARKLDSDNAHGALKHVRDQIADWLGIDDGREDLVTWEVAQETGKPVGVKVVITAKESA